jgi:hypothetical protein
MKYSATQKLKFFAKPSKVLVYNIILRSLARISNGFRLCLPLP